MSSFKCGIMKKIFLLFFIPSIIPPKNVLYCYANHYLLLFISMKRETTFQIKLAYY